MSMTEKAQWAGIALLGVGGYLLYKKFKDKLPDKDTFNPASQKNIANRGANKVMQVVTGDKYATVGGKVFEKLNPNAAAYDPNAPLLKDYPVFNAVRMLLPVTTSLPTATGLRASSGINVGQKAATKILDLIGFDDYQP